MKDYLGDGPIRTDAMRERTIGRVVGVIPQAQPSLINDDVPVIGDPVLRILAKRVEFGAKLREACEGFDWKRYDKPLPAGDELDCSVSTILRHRVALGSS